MIVFELNGELNYMIPVLFSVVISYAVSNNLAISIFDVLLEMKNLPYLPALRSADLYDKSAKDIMSKNFLYLTEDSRLKDIVVLLQYLGPHSRSIPVVESEEDRILIYAIQAQSLRKYLFALYSENRHNFDDETRAKMNKYFSSLYSISQVNLRKFNRKIKPGSEEELVLQFMKDDNNISANKRTLSFDSLHDIEDSSKYYLGNRKESTTLIKNFNQKELYDTEGQDTTSYNAKSEFWYTKIDYNHEFLDIDKSPFAIMSETPLTKVHFLFLMLSISQLFVTRKGVVIGVISKNEFLSLNKNYAQTIEEINVEAESVDEEDHHTLGTEYIESILTHPRQDEEESDEEVEEQVDNQKFKTN